MPEPSGLYIVRLHNQRWTLFHMPAGCTHPTRISSYHTRRAALTVAYLMAGRVDHVIVD